MTKDGVRIAYAALTSGNYIQGYGQYIDKDNKFCALAVILDAFDLHWFFDGPVERFSMSEAIDLCDRFHLSYDEANKIIHWNYNDKKTFNEIANLILLENGNNVAIEDAPK